MLKRKESIKKTATRELIGGGCLHYGVESWKHESELPQIPGGGQLVPFGKRKEIP